MGSSPQLGQHCSEPSDRQTLQCENDLVPTLRTVVSHTSHRSCSKAVNTYRAQVGQGLGTHTTQHNRGEKRPETAGTPQNRVENVTGMDSNGLLITAVRRWLKYMKSGLWLSTMRRQENRRRSKGEDPRRGPCWPPKLQPYYESRETRNVSVMSKVVCARSYRSQSVLL